MEQSFVLAGFGGQGVILAGKILAQAGADHGLQVTWLPSYGPEMRGGTANCTVVLSDEAIGSPVVDNPTVLVAMNLPSLDRFEKTVAKGGTMLINSSLITRPAERNDLQVLNVPVNDTAVSLGDSRAANMVALGTVIKTTGTIPLELVKSAMVKMLSHKDDAELIAVNQQSLDAGYNAVEKRVWQPPPAIEITCFPARSSSC
jgi:2-oxoglutarate ferredoxin oxidoreductase subunit gamma